MGIFDFLKKKKTGIEENKFLSNQFQNEISALALWKLEENNLNSNVAIYELKKVGLNDEQIDFVLEKIKKTFNYEFNVSNSKKTGIEETKFNSEDYQKEILDYSQKIYFQNNNRYEIVKHELLKDGLNTQQAEVIIQKLEKKNSDMVNDFQEQLNSGAISEIRIEPNPEHKKGNVNDDQVDKYIGLGAFQMEKGYLENALELFDKAIEIDENATLAYANKGKLYSLQNENEKALFFINKALEIEPNHKQIIDNKVNLVFQLFQEYKIPEEEFIKNIKDILSNDSENPNAQIYLIQYYLKQNQINDALELLKNLFSNYHSETITIQLMLDIFSKLSEKQVFEQFDLIETEVNEEAKYQLHYNKGLYLKGLGKYEEAIQLYNELNKIHEFTWNYYQMGIMKNLQGKTDESLELLKTTFSLEPELKQDAKTFPELENLWTNSKFIEITK